MHRSQDSPTRDSADERAFLAAVTSSRPALSAVALRIVGNEHDAADVVQDSCLRAWRALPSFRGDSKLSTWLHAIVVNASLSTLQRRRQRGTDSLSELDDTKLADPHGLADPHSAAEQTELRHTLLLAVQCLSDPLREVVVRRELRGLSHGEIATELGISETASKVRLHRARAQLRTALGADRPSDDDQLPIGA
jgi:RNA polymerase sigma-70 factor (ECF subfamily)